VIRYAIAGMNSMKNDLFCYILNYSSNPHTWASGYQSALEAFFYHASNGQELDRYYKDPDISSDAFYTALAEFLNEREAALAKQLFDRYTYEKCNEQGLCIKVLDAEKNLLFYLKSDQLGFSAPGKKRNHPYDTYLLKFAGSTEDAKENAAQQVVRWVMTTRSLGGSFLWPMEKTKTGLWKKNPQYNLSRGGVLEDCADSTLFEIRQVYAHHTDVLLANCCKPGSYMKKWLDHFGSFQTYVAFFCFDAFVIKKTPQEWEIVDIIQSSLKDKKQTALKDIHTRRIYKGRVHNVADASLLDAIGFETMFNNLSTLIKDRSEKMMRK
jgi:hypothetical protein